MGVLEHHVKNAINGNKHALEEVVKAVQDMIYNLSLRMLWHPEDAKDATQEILIKAVTNLAKFEFKSSFKTWLYRLAANELLNYRSKHLRMNTNFDAFQEQLIHNQREEITYTQNEAERDLLIQEAKIGCSKAMLQCLDRKSRLTYIVGEILEFNSREASIILAIRPEAFRKRLSRIRLTIRSFVHNNCGLVNPENNCRCHKNVDDAIDKGLIDPGNLLFTSNTKSHHLINAIDHIQNEVELYQSNPDYAAPEMLLKEVKRIITTANNV